MKSLRTRFLTRKTRGQTALEYAMVMVVIILPLVAALRAMLLEESKDGEKDNLTRKLTSVSYGDE